jgi:hypothetical protein
VGRRFEATYVKCAAILQSPFKTVKFIMRGV